MKKREAVVLSRTVVVILCLLLSAVAGCRVSSPWVPLAPDQKVHGMLDIPLQKLREEPEDYVGTVFEDQFKYYRIYHDRGDADPALRGQVIEGETHFTARPVKQYLQIVQVEITPAQEDWIRENGIQRQDAIRARVRFKGIAPGGALTFQLLEILEPASRSGT